MAGNLTLSPATGYFVDHKKGEVNELKQLLSNINIERDIKRKRDVIKKVIAYMTLGVDVSRLFNEMIMAIETKDMVIKKMVYLYLCNYAHKKPDMAIMCINTLLRDCDNEDPMVRGLALRSLCNLRLSSILEYISKPLMKSLNDIAPYVRKTAVMCVLKLHHFHPEHIENERYIPLLYTMLNDTQASVVINCIYVLHELLLSKGGIEISHTLLLQLLTRLSEFTEWGLQMILELVANYRTNSEDEIFAIMNLLDPLFKTSNSSSVLSIFKCFMKLTMSHMSDMHDKILIRAKSSLITLLIGTNIEVQYTILKHLQIILPLPFAKSIFDDDYRHFFLRYNEPSYIKLLKIDVIPYLTNENNVQIILSELMEYITDVNIECSKKSIDSIGTIAIKLSSSRQYIVNILIPFMEMDIIHIRSQIIKSIARLSRVDTAVCAPVISILAKHVKRIEDNEAKSLVIYLLGEYYNTIQDIPYLLEPFIDNYNDESSSMVKQTLLTACMKVFIYRAPEMQYMLGRLFQHALSDSTCQDTHDKALLYYRLLNTDISVTKQIFTHCTPNLSDVPFNEYIENQDHIQSKSLWNDMNTLAVIYGLPVHQFIEDKYILKLDNAPMIDEYLNPPPPISLTTTLMTTPSKPSTTSTDLLNTSVLTSTIQTSTSTTATAHITESLLDFDSPPPPPVSVSTSTITTSHTAASLLSSTTLTNELILNPNIQITPDRFQQLWSQYIEYYNNTSAFLLIKQPSTTQEIETICREQHIITIASGLLSTNPKEIHMKFFMYAEGYLSTDVSTSYSFLIQLIVKIPGEASLIIKSNQSGSHTQLFVDTIKAILSRYM